MNAESPDDGVGDITRSIDEECDRFEAAWRGGDPPDVEDYLDHVPDEQRRELLFELVAIDLDYRWREGTASQPYPLESYLERFPELTSKSYELALEEYRAQKQASIECDPEGIIQRFPHLGDDLRPALQEIDEQSNGTASHSHISVRCPHCRSSTQLPEQGSFSNIRCDHCRQRFSLANDPANEGARLLGRFQLLHKIGEGGFASVWKAEDTELQRTVAVKIPHKRSLNEDDVADLVREARAAAHLQHPNIVRILEVGREDNVVFVVSEFVAGTPLDQWLMDHPMTALEAARFCRKIALALQYAHQAGVIHRDLKPSNIILDAAGEPHVLDFGLARRGTDEVTVNMQGKILGTPAYMPPEQARGEANNSDTRSDIYSLGVLLYELLTGERPFRGNLQSLLHQVISEEPTSPRHLNRTVPRDLEILTLKCLEKEPRLRIQSAGELADELQRFLQHQPIHSRPISLPVRGFRWCKRNPMATLVAALLILMTVAGVATATRQVRLQQLAGRSEQQMRRMLYVSDIDVAQQAWEFANIFRMRETLSRHRPRPGQSDLRGFEWYYLWNLAHQGLQTLPHSEGVRAVRFASDDSLVSLDGSAAWRWDWRSSQNTNIARFSGVTSSAISADGSMLALGHADQAVILWDLDSGQPTRTLTGKQQAVSSIAFSPDGKLLAAGGWDNQVSLWDVATGKPLGVLSGHRQAIRCLSFSSDNVTLASGGYDNTVRLWNTTELVQLHLLSEHSNGVESVAFSPDGQRLVSGGWDNTVKLWQTSTGELLSSLDGHRQAVTSVAFAPDGNSIISGGYDQTVRLWDARTGESQAVLKGHSDVVTSVTFSPSGNVVASSGDDGLVKVWQFDSNRPRDVLNGHSNSLTSIAFSADDNLLATGSHDHTIKLWDVPSGRQLAELAGHQNNVWSLDFSPSRRLLASGSEDHSVILWDVDNRQSIHTFSGADGHQGWVIDVAFSPDGQQLATAGFDDVIKIWDMSNRRLVHTLTGHTDNVLAIDFSPDGQRLASAGHDLTIRIWDVETGKLIRTIANAHEAQIQGLAFSPRGDALASGGYDQTIRLWNPATGQRLADLACHTDIHCVIFASDGGTLYSGGDDATVTVWDLGALAIRGRLRGHAAGVWDIAVSSDGQTLASASWDDTARLWRASSPAPTADEKARP